jgi:copper(I)-binding protein
MMHSMRRALPGLSLPALSGLVLLALPALAMAGAPSVSGAWARATPPGVSVGAAYLTITGGSTSDRLVGATTDRASMVQLHTVEESNGVAAMRQVDGVAVPAGKQVALAPGGTHIMLMGLNGPLLAGETFPLQLRFENAGEQVVQVAVRAADEPGPAAPAEH